jgi:hypothetical protein
MGSDETSERGGSLHAPQDSVNKRYTMQPSPSVPNVRILLKSCDNPTRSDQKHGGMVRWHGAWAHGADAVI